MQTVGALTALTILTGAAMADPPPPISSDPISLDRASPSVMFFGNTPGDIYGEPGGPLAGWDVGGPGPLLHVADGTYGLTVADNQDGHSNGEDEGPQYVIYFSGDDLSIGAAGTEYRHQAVRDQAAGDRFVSNGWTTTHPLAGPTGIFGPILPGPINLLSANQHRYNEIPSIGPLAFNTFVPPGPGSTVMDDMDALELTPFDTTGDNIHDTPIYFNLDAASPSLAPFAPVGTGGTVFLSPPGIAGFGVFAPFFTLGLVPGDEVDALAVWNLDGGATAGLGDYAIFSLAPGSPTLAAMGYSPADVIATGFTGTNSLWIPAAALGMLPSDNIDGLDVEVTFNDPSRIERFDVIPEPSALALAAISCTLVGAAARGRRRRRA